MNIPVYGAVGSLYYHGFLMTPSAIDHMPICIMCVCVCVCVYSCVGKERV